MVFPSMQKGDIVAHCVVIDVKGDVQDDNNIIYEE